MQLNRMATFSGNGGAIDWPLHARTLAGCEHLLFYPESARTTSIPADADESCQTPGAPRRFTMGVVLERF